MQDMPHRAIEQSAIMADDKDSVRIFGQIGLKPERPLKIEIVGGFVQEQEIRLREKNGGQGHAHPPPARKIGTGAGGFRIGKAQTPQDRGGARLGRPSINIGKPCLYLSHAFARSGFRLGHEGGALCIGGQDSVEQRHRAARHFLADAPNARAGGDLNHPTIKR